MRAEPDADPLCTNIAQEGAAPGARNPVFEGLRTSFSCNAVIILPYSAPCVPEKGRRFINQRTLPRSGFVRAEGSFPAQPWWCSVEAYNAGWLSILPPVLAIILALLFSYFLKHTRPGLHLRSVGESASTADAAGINVTRYKYLATCIGSMIAGLGGLYYVMDYASGVWSNNAFGDRGWLAIALVIFTIWRPNVSVLASILFGGLYILYLYIPTGTQMAVKELYKMLPYVVTVVVLVISSLRNNKEKQPPASLGLSYFREER